MNLGLETHNSTVVDGGGQVDRGQAPPSFCSTPRPPFPIMRVQRRNDPGDLAGRK